MLSKGWAEKRKSKRRHHICLVVIQAFQVWPLHKYFQVLLSYVITVVLCPALFRQEASITTNWRVQIKAPIMTSRSVSWRGEVFSNETADFELMSFLSSLHLFLYHLSCPSVYKALQDYFDILQDITCHLNTSMVHGQTHYELLGVI